MAACRTPGPGLRHSSEATSPGDPGWAEGRRRTAVSAAVRRRSWPDLTWPDLLSCVSGRPCRARWPMCMLRAVCWAGPAGAWPRDVSFTAAHEGSGCDVRLCAVFLMSVRARVCVWGRGIRMSVLVVRWTCHVCSSRSAPTIALSVGCRQSALYHAGVSACEWSGVVIASLVTVMTCPIYCQVAIVCDAEYRYTCLSSTWFSYQFGIVHL